LRFPPSGLVPARRELAVLIVEHEAFGAAELLGLLRLIGEACHPQHPQRPTRSVAAVPRPDTPEFQDPATVIMQTEPRIGIQVPHSRRRERAEVIPLETVALRADAAQTNLCTYLSAVVLVGLAANAAVGWWWMDPVAGLVVAVAAVREGIQAWRSGDLCAC
jgi:hypothetical protein